MRTGKTLCGMLMVAGAVVLLALPAIPHPDTRTA